MTMNQFLSGRPLRRGAWAIGIAFSLLLGACGGADIDYSDQTQNQAKNRDTIFGKGGIFIFGGEDEDEAAASGGGIGVNSFLWRAALDTVSFMPLASADPFGGVVITDWYQPPESPTERFKVNVYILDNQLRSDGIRASVFRQLLHPSGSWIDAPVRDGTSTQLENSILTRARQLRISSLATAN